MTFAVHKAALIAGAALMLAQPAVAQTPTTPTSAMAQAGQTQPGLGGTAIPGLCLLSREAVFANAKVSAAATTRLQQLSQEAQAEVDAERKPIDADITAFQAEAAKLKPEERTKREQMLAARLQPVQIKANQRSREIEATRVKVLERISTEAQPVIASVYTQKKCGLLVDRNSALGGNFANDLTADVVKGLDAKMSTISFNREILPAQVANNAGNPAVAQ